MSDVPYSTHIHEKTCIPAEYDNHIVRRLSAMNGQFSDAFAYEAALNQEDRILYEVYELARPETSGELLSGTSIVHPGKIGAEYNMTKGHFHSILETAEIYYCLQGNGKMVMETPEGNWAVEDLTPGRVLYVPPRWAHRSVNTGSSDLITFFVYPAYAGHDYGSIEIQGFRKLVLERGGEAVVVDNPRWLPPEGR